MSDIFSNRIENIRDLLQDGDTVNVLLKGTEKDKFQLSMKGIKQDSTITVREAWKKKLHSH